jgi:hypothetical protein
MQSGRQPVDAGADHDRIMGHSRAPALSYTNPYEGPADRLPAQIFHI